MEYAHIDDLLKSISDHIIKSCSPVRVAVAAAHEEHVIEAVVKAWQEGIVSPILVGRTDDILSFLSSVHVGENALPIVYAETDEDAAQLSVNLVKQGQAEFLMKGLMNTSTLLHAVLKKGTGLPHSETVSHFVLAEITGYHKLVAYTDVGINIQPNLDQKKNILLNAVSVMRHYGVEKPKVAVLSAVELVNSKMSETVDGHALKEMCAAGELGNCYVEGPISFDLALDQEAASVKHFNSPVAGDADILLVPNVVSGNIMAKAIKTFAGLKSIALALGASVPIVVTSRATSVDSKYRSIVAAAGIVRNGN